MKQKFLTKTALNLKQNKNRGDSKNVAQNKIENGDYLEYC